MLRLSALPDFQPPFFELIFADLLKFGKGFGGILYYIIIIRNPRNPILIIKAPTLPSPGLYKIPVTSVQLATAGFPRTGVEGSLGHKHPRSSLSHPNPT